MDKYIPKISVIVPVYNVEKYIGQCIESILNQTFRDFELILINDGSFDYSYKICREFAKKDARISLFSQENKGQAAARNLGIENACGEYLTFIDSDDYVTSDYLEKLYHTLTKYQCDIVMTGYYRYDEQTNLLYYYIQQENVGQCERISQTEILKRMLTDANYLQVVAKIFKRTLFENLRFDVGRYFEDFFLITKLFLQVDSVVYLKDSLYCYRRNVNSIVNSPLNIKKVIDDIESYEETILTLLLSHNDPKPFIDKYKSVLLYHKHLLEDKQLFDLNIYKKIITRLNLLGE